jgi:hypothetical protein
MGPGFNLSAAADRSAGVDAVIFGEIVYGTELAATMKLNRA